MDVVSPPLETRGGGGGSWATLIKPCAKLLIGGLNTVLAALSLTQSEVPLIASSAVLQATVKCKTSSSKDRARSLIQYVSRDWCVVVGVWGQLMRLFFVTVSHCERPISHLCRCVPPCPLEVHSFIYRLRLLRYSFSWGCRCKSMASCVLSEAFPPPDKRGSFNLKTEKQDGSRLDLVSAEMDSQLGHQWMVSAAVAVCL